MSSDRLEYVSFETALSAHGVLDDCVHALRIATVAGDRREIVPGVGLVEWIALPDDLLFGDRPGTALDFPDRRIADPEKALCDLLWLCEERGFAVPIESLRLDDVDPLRLRAYAERMGLDLAPLRLDEAGR